MVVMLALYPIDVRPTVKSQVESGVVFVDPVAVGKTCATYAIVAFTRAALHLVPAIFTVVVMV